MKIQFRVGRAAPCNTWPEPTRFGQLSAPLVPQFPSVRPNCSKKDPQGNSGGKGDKSSRDWDKAWTSFKKQGKKSLFSGFSNKYVSWNPKRSEYPLAEEVDPIKKTERSNLVLWTSPGFTLGGAIVIVSLLLIYTLLSPVK